MAGPSASTEKRAVEYSVAPASHLWVAVCLGFAGAVFAAGLLLGLGEVVYGIERLLLEALFLAG